MTIHKLDNLLAYCQERLDGEVQINMLRTFIFVGQRGTCTQKDVEIMLKTSTASASRAVSYWTDRRFDKQAGWGFIQRVLYDDDRRFRQLSLTNEGKKFYKKMEDMLR